LCLMPSLLAVAGAASMILLSRLHAITRWARPWGPRMALLGALLVGLLEYAPKVSTTVALLDNKQEAYAAIARDAEERGGVPRALAVVLWPGDSHYASVYQYYSSLYRVRLVNGYSPSVDAAYFHDIFGRFESMNQGDIHADQLDALLRMETPYILLHENLFPLQVSPFRIGHTLHRLLNEPRLELLAKDGPVWAFRILEQARPAEPVFTDWVTWFPTRVWQANHLHYPQPVPLEKDAFSTFVQLPEGDEAVTRFIRVHEGDNTRWMLRVRGEGALILETLDRDWAVIETHTLSSMRDDWHWHTLRIESVAKGQEWRALRLRGRDQPVSVSTILLTAGTWAGLEPFEPIRLPAGLFFHDGYTLQENGGVRLRADHDRADLIFHGPHLPLAPGRYEVSWRLSSEAPAGFILGEMQMQMQEHPPGDTTPVRVGGTASLIWEQKANLPVWLQFRYNRKADMTIYDVEIRPLALHSE
jgi:hypothetical protein